MFDVLVESLSLTGWTNSWLRNATFEQNRDSRAIQRSFEQIVNDLQEMAELLENAAYRAGLTPDPGPVSQARSSPDARAAWWSAAEELKLPVHDADRAVAPGRWRRLAYLGAIEHSLATELKSASDTRQLFQHGYAHRDTKRALEVWRTMADVRAQLKPLVEGLDRLLEEIIAAG